MKSSNERSFGSLVAGVLTNREGNCPEEALFHRTDEGAPGPEIANGRLQAAQARNTEIIRENVEAFNRRESEIQKQIKQFKAETRNALAEIEAAHSERKAALSEIKRLTRLVKELAKENS